MTAGKGYKKIIELTERLHVEVSNRQCRGGNRRRVIMQRQYRADTVHILTFMDNPNSKGALPFALR
jgi:hypothetical protein